MENTAYGCVKMCYTVREDFGDGRRFFCGLSGAVQEKRMVSKMQRIDSGIYDVYL